MDKELSGLEELLSIIANAIAIIISLSGAAISIKKEAFCLLILFAILIFFNGFFLSQYIKKIKYINFVEYLFNNNVHRFTLLPKFRIYIESKKKKNKLYITNLNVKYEITKNEDYIENVGDLQIDYTLKIKNKRLPKQYYMIFGNDYAEHKPIIEYSLCGRPMTPAIFIEAKHSSYERGIINEAVIDLEYENLPKKEIELKITQKYINSFNFSVTNTDTLILLPLLYGTKIDEIDYEINLKKFDDYPKLYCNAYKIGRNKKWGENYEIKDISIDLEGSDLTKKITLQKPQPESAYYFRIGINEEKMEP